MVNQILKKEHKIFENQKPSDLNELVETQVSSSSNDIFVNFEIRDWQIKNIVKSTTNIEVQVGDRMQKNENFFKRLIFLKG